MVEMEKQKEFPSFEECRRALVSSFPEVRRLWGDVRNQYAALSTDPRRIGELRQCISDDVALVVTGSRQASDIGLPASSHQLFSSLAALRNAAENYIFLLEGLIVGSKNQPRMDALSYYIQFAAHDLKNDGVERLALYLRSCFSVQLMESQLFGMERIEKVGEVLKKAENFVRFLSIEMTPETVYDAVFLQENRTRTLEATKGSSMMVRWAGEPTEMHGEISHYPPITDLVLEELAENARKAHATYIAFTMRERSGCLEIVAENDGVAIAREKLDKIFLLSGEGSTSGSGIGLPLLKKGIEDGTLFPSMQGRNKGGVAITSAPFTDHAKGVTDQKPLGRTVLTIRIPLMQKPVKGPSAQLKEQIQEAAVSETLIL